MVTTKQTILLFLFSIFISPLLAQVSSDIIYRFNEEPLACVVSDITDREIRYKNARESTNQEYSLEKDKALLIFRENGDFLLPYGDQSIWVSGADERIHKIITKDHLIYPARFLEVEAKRNKISYQDYNNQTNREIAINDVLIVIHKDGSHQLFAPTTLVVEALNQLGPNLDIYAESKGIDADVPSLNIIELTAEQEVHFVQVAETKAHDFGKYLSLLSSQDEEVSDKLYAVEAACTLFVNDSAKVEVSSTKSMQKRQFPIRDYLDRLRVLPYDRVEITWLQAQMVCGLRPGVDGNYYGVIAAQQLFKGYLDNKVVYQDVTDKDIEVVLKRYEVFDEGEKAEKWDVFLSSIGVQQTRNN